MGLTIYYNGKFNTKTFLTDLIEEARDVAEVYKWKYHVFETEFDEKLLNKKSFNENIYGICFSPPECETVWLTFLSNGRMSNHFNLEMYGTSTDKREQEYLYMLFTKTQYAGIEIHKLVIHLLRHLSKKYFIEFNLTDEGEYWETSDEKVLQKNFNLYNELINSFASALTEFPMQKGEDFEEYFLRLLKGIQEAKLN